MILTVDVGNTNVVFGGYKGDRLVFTSRMDSVVSRMEDQYAVSICDMLKLYEYSPEAVDGAIISSVVPPITSQLKRAIEKLCGCKVMVVSPGMKTGLNIKIDDPSTLGSDLVCVAVAGKNLYQMPCIIVDLGTANKIIALDKSSALLGGVIAPGIKISMEALSAKTASLPIIGLEPVDKVIGTNTVDCMRSGILTGCACMIDGMIERFEEQFGAKATVVATGGYSSVIAPMCKKQMILNQNLIFEGLHIIYEKNK